LRCIICGIVIDSIEEAIEAGCIPYFYEGDQQHEPACRECSEILLRVNENGEMEVREEYPGKIKHLDGSESKERPRGGRVMGIAVREGEGGRRH
jgi:hypothetical protein